MKKVLFLILCLFSLSVVYAKSYDLDKLAKVIEKGTITKEYIEGEKAAGCDVSITAHPGIDTISVSMYFNCSEAKKKAEENKDKYKLPAEYSAVFSMTLDSKGVLKGEYVIPKKQVEDEADYFARVAQLIPFWGAEMSSKSEEIENYIDSLHDGKYLETYREIFDKCDYQEMGVCYTMVTSYGDNEYTFMINMNDNGAEYALKYLKKEEDEAKNKKMVVRLMIVAGVIIVIMAVCKSVKPTAKTTY